MKDFPVLRVMFSLQAEELYLRELKALEACHHSFGLVIDEIMFTGSAMLQRHLRDK